MNNMNITIGDNSITITRDKIGRITFLKEEADPESPVIFDPYFNLIFSIEGEAHAYSVKEVPPDLAFKVAQDFSMEDAPVIANSMELLSSWLDLRELGYKTMEQ